MSDETRYVRNRTDQAVFVKGHGSIPGKEGADVKPSDALDAAIEARVLEEAERPQEEAPKTRRNTTDKSKEGGQ